LDPIMAVFTAPDNMRKPTMTMKAWKRSLNGVGPTRYNAMPLIAAGFISNTSSIYIFQNIKTLFLTKEGLYLFT
jgi:hypothetical protein